MATVIEVLRAFLPDYLRGKPLVFRDQTRAIWAITHCRTAVMGGNLYTCEKCGKSVFAYHSCNHKACPQCGRAAAARWVSRELERRVGAPYFMVTFTLPAELRGLFHGQSAREAYEAFFAASSAALREKLAVPRWLGAQVSGFTGVLHTWNQRLLPHHHIHYIVPGAGIAGDGTVVVVKNANFLLPVGPLRGAFRHHFRRQLQARDWEVDPTVWRKAWGVHIKPFGSGANAIKYLGAYVSRTAIGDSRIRSIDLDGRTVTFRFKDRDDGGTARHKLETVSGVEFIRRYLRHVLPRRMHAIRRYGFCHPAAKKTRERIAFHTGRSLFAGSHSPAGDQSPQSPRCPSCQASMQRSASFPPIWFWSKLLAAIAAEARSRAPPVPHPHPQPAST